VEPGVPAVAAVALPTAECARLLLVPVNDLWRTLVEAFRWVGGSALRLGAFVVSVFAFPEGQASRREPPGRRRGPNSTSAQAARTAEVACLRTVLERTKSAQTLAWADFGQRDVWISSGCRRYPEFRVPDSLRDSESCQSKPRAASDSSTVNPPNPPYPRTRKGTSRAEHGRPPL